MPAIIAHRYLRIIAEPPLASHRFPRTGAYRGATHTALSDPLGVYGSREDQAYRHNWLPAQASEEVLLTVLGTSPHLRAQQSRHRADLHPQGTPSRRSSFSCSKSPRSSPRSGSTSISSLAPCKLFSRINHGIVAVLPCAPKSAQDGTGDNREDVSNEDPDHRLSRHHRLFR
jgi:hypothetical protein